MKVKGIKKELSHGGSIFIGVEDGSSSNTNLYFEFVNAQGENTKLGLSREAWDALKEADKKLFPVDGRVLKESKELSWITIEK